MYPFDYAVSLQVSHPTKDLEAVTKELGLLPQTCWRSGEPKKTPQGELLAGVRAESYWSYRFEHPDGISLSDFLESVANKLKVHEQFLQSLSLAGGSLRLFIGWFSGSNSGDQFTWELLNKLAGLRIGLSFDVYGEPQEAPMSGQGVGERPDSAC